MKAKLLSVLLGALVASSPLAFADDSQIMRRSISSSPGQTAVHEPEGEHAYVNLMNFYVPSQAANGELVEIEYFNIDEVLEHTATIAKPLFGFYLYGPVITFEDFSQSAFPGHGRRDAFIAVSLDDGATWKRTNLSNSADKSSFTLTENEIPDPALSAGLEDIEVDPDGPTVAAADWEDSRRGGELEVSGELSDDLNRNLVVTVRNAVTREVLGTTTAEGDEWDLEVRVDDPPCTVQAGVDGSFGPAVEVENAPEDCVGQLEVVMIDEYPGDVTNGTFAVAGNRVMAAWQSKFCRSGFPVWGAEYPVDEVATYLGIDNLVDFYLVDLFAVAGSQGSVNYVEQEEFDGEYDDVGQVPYNCLWTARGVLREDPENEGTTEVVFFQAERLTSGRRDVNRIEVGCVAGAGCAVTWQEDPEGLRPGEGEGPGTGWAGATTNSETEVWYSFVRWEDFDIVGGDDTTDPLPLADQILDTGRPQPYVPMMAAARLTNNARCPVPVTDRGDYCEDAFAGPYQIKNQCIATVDAPLGPQGELQPICVADSNRSGAGDVGDLPNVGNTASSRPRLSLQPRDSDGDGIVDDAWVNVFAEEDKGLGRFFFLNDEVWSGDVANTGTICSDETLDNCQTADIGKNAWWMTFAMGTPKTSVALSNGEVAAADVEFSLLNNVVSQHNMANQPEVNWRTGTMYPPMATEDMWDFGTYNYLIFNNEIARRTSMMTQSLAKAATGTSGMIALPLYKQGIVRQGGPADIMGRRFVLADLVVDETTGIASWMTADGTATEATANPYDFANMECLGRLEFADGSNPYYPKGLCLGPAINLSAVTPLECEASGIGDGECPGVAECTDTADFGQLCTVADLENDDPEDQQLFDKLLSWYACPGSTGVTIGGTGVTVPACGTEDISTLLGTNLDDQSWYMSLDVAKGHRGFLDGDFVMMLYGWSPNWKFNKVGTDRYELYVRRSFDGGVTWTTTPADGLASDGVTPYAGAGTTTCETWRTGAEEVSTEEDHVCTVYGAGEDEQPRNVTQHRAMRITTLDPRYTPTLATMTDLSEELADYGTHFTFEPQTIGTTSLAPTDVRDPSRYFLVYETGDNTTVAEGEAEPLDLFYSRGVMFGDHYQVWAEEDDLSVCYPDDPHEDEDVDYAVGTGFCNEFDDLEGRKDSQASEASLKASAYGDFLYAVWAQWNHDQDGDLIDADAMLRRVWWLDGYISEDAWSLPGTEQTGTTP